MVAKNQDLHGQVPDTAPVALLIIDMINDLEFEDGERQFASALPAARRIADLKRRAKEAGIPTIYVNDNFGRWQSDLNKLVDHCRQDGMRGKPLVELLLPEEDDYFVLKPKHSGFYSTTLDTLLRYLAAQTLILTGVAGNLCVFFTANDAYMRDYHLIIPQDCVASLDPADNEHAMDQMRRFLHADISPSDRLEPAALRARYSKAEHDC